jgi:hypothetical protein
MSEILVELGAGELIDKITILRIKSERIEDADKLNNIRFELGVLEETCNRHVPSSEEIKRLTDALKTVNEALWEIEDDIRDCESESDFGDKFIQLARSVYITNDKRAALKKEINLATGARIIEEKSYKDY